MSDITKTFCPDCKREVLNVVGFIADGWEFTCGKCNQRFVVRIERKLTKRTPDGLTPGQSEQVRQMIQNALDTGSA